MKIAFCVAMLCLINISMVSSQLGHVSSKKCADFVLNPINDFRKDEYIGAWFMYQMYDLLGSEEYDCYVSLLTPYENESLNLTEIWINEIPKLRFEGVITLSEDGKGVATYTSLDDPEYNIEYYVISTDYVTYTVEVSCQNIDDGSIQQLYVRTRLPVVTDPTRSQINDVITASKLEQPIRTLDIIKSCPSQLIGNYGNDGLLAGLLKLVTSLLGAVLGLLGGLLG